MVILIGNDKLAPHADCWRPSYLAIWNWALKEFGHPYPNQNAVSATVCKQNIWHRNQKLMQSK